MDETHLNLNKDASIGIKKYKFTENVFKNIKAMNFINVCVFKENLHVILIFYPLYVTYLNGIRLLTENNIHKLPDGIWTLNPFNVGFLPIRSRSPSFPPLPKTFMEGNF